MLHEQFLLANHKSSSYIYYIAQFTYIFYYSDKKVSVSEHVSYIGVVNHVRGVKKRYFATRCL